MEKFGISGQIIEGIYHSDSSDNWILLKTDQSTFELRLGGINPTNEIRSEKYLMNLAIGYKPIKSIKTDDFAIYIELASGECVVHSQSFISGDGEIEFDVRLISKEEFESDRLEWYDEDMEMREIL